MGARFRKPLACERRRSDGATEMEIAAAAAGAVDQRESRREGGSQIADKGVELGCRTGLAHAQIRCRDREGVQ